MSENEDNKSRDMESIVARTRSRKKSSNGFPRAVNSFLYHLEGKHRQKNPVDSDFICFYNITRAEDCSKVLEKN